MSYMKQSLRPSRSASGSIDYPSGRVYGCLSPDDPDDEPETEPEIEDDGFVTVDMHKATAPGDESICPVCHGSGSVPCSGTRDGMDYDTVEDCPNCSEPLRINGVWRRQF